MNAKVRSCGNTTILQSSIDSLFNQGYNFIATKSLILLFFSVSIVFYIVLLFKFALLLFLNIVNISNSLCCLTLRRLYFDFLTNTTFIVYTIIVTTIIITLLLMIIITIHKVHYVITKCSKHTHQHLSQRNANILHSCLYLLQITL